MAYIALILHVNGVPMTIISIHVYIHIHPASFTLRTVYALNYLGCSAPPLKNFRGARAPLAPPSYAYDK